MSAQAIILAIISALLPILGVILPGVLKQDKLAPQWNSMIAAVVIIVIAALQAWAQNAIHLINPYLDFMAVLAAMSALLAGPLKGLDLYLQSFVGPGATKVTTVVPVPPVPSSTTGPVASSQQQQV